MKLEIQNTENFIDKAKFVEYKANASKANKSLYKKNGLGNDFLGWVNLPNKISEELISDIEQTAESIRKKIEVMVTVGIGGSYLGAKAVIEALSDNFSTLKNEANPKMLFAGNNLSEDYLFELSDLLKTKDWAITVISKSGTTTEPAVAFRILKAELEKKYGEKEASNRIIAVTDKEKGALKQLANQEAYKTFIIPDDVGGRYSVLTPVGLLPIAVAGFDIRKLIQGAIDTAKNTSVEKNENYAEIYAAVRNLLYDSGFTNEILVNYNPKLSFFAEWWKQLYGESEGKEGKGIFPASVSFTTDLHSMGQYIQDGKRNLFETVISVEKTKYNIILEKDKTNLDKLNYLAGKNIEEINKSAELGTLNAHLEGGVPNIRITIPEINEYNIGELIYFFEKACGISGYILGVNPFDQPGVEAYKRNMFQILGKPGY
ncbi:MAG: glucose-6-phosphate isomerase [Bacteroidetes bacterium]|nr:MAG: glucose-6-phosphate isomerase [Bacteroidota bacterium]